MSPERRPVPVAYWRTLLWVGAGAAMASPGFVAVVTCMLH